MDLKSDGDNVILDRHGKEGLALLLLALGPVRRVRKLSGIWHRHQRLIAAHLASRRKIRGLPHLKKGALDDNELHFFNLVRILAGFPCRACNNKPVSAFLSYIWIFLVLTRCLQ